MATTTNIDTLVINYLTEAQYEAAVQGGTIDENALYFTPDSGGGAIPTKLSDLTNDVGFITLNDLPVYSGGVQ